MTPLNIKNEYISILNTFPLSTCIHKKSHVNERDVDEGT